MFQLKLKKEKRIGILARIAQRRYSPTMAEEDNNEETIELKLEQILNAAPDDCTAQLVVNHDDSITLNRSIPQELLNATMPTTTELKTREAVKILPSSLLKEVEDNSTEETQILSVKNLPLKQKKQLEFEGTIDSSGRIQLPASSLFDSRIRPGRRLKITIEFKDLTDL